MFINFGQSHNTYNHPFHIEEEPLRRGTISLLFTCLLTNSMCVWQAVHLNVPGSGTCGKYQQWGRRAALLFLGLLAPEVVAYVAWQQRRSAKKLLENDVPDGRRKHGYWWGRSDPERHDPCKWSMTHAFYAIMGGFAVRFKDPVDGLPTTPDNQYTILPDGVRRLLDKSPDSITQISVEDIDDKSKGDSITKTLVMMQATYFIYQCVVRWHGHLPISILEHNTFGHAVCSVLIYCLWWKKPLNIGKPTLLSNSQVEEILRQAQSELQTKKRTNGVDTENGGAFGQAVDKFCFPQAGQFFAWLTNPDPTGALGPRATNRPKLKPLSPKNTTLRECLINSLGVTLTLGIYALLHLVAWNGLFTTRTEKLLWRTSSIILVLSSIIYFLQALWSINKEPMTWRLDCRKPGSIALGFLIFMTLVLCFLARLFLVVESFWNLFHLPADVYELPPWSAYYPRFF